MELRDYIEQGAKKAGSLTELGKILDMSQPTISGAKAHKRPMTNKAVVQLAEYIGATRQSLNRWNRPWGANFSPIRFQSVPVINLGAASPRRLPAASVATKNGQGY